jgi:hypothetical protein
VVEIDERIGWPQLCTQLVPRDQLTRSLRQDREDLHWDSLDWQPQSTLPQFARRGIQFKHTEPDYPAWASSAGNGRHLKIAGITCLVAKS